MGAFVSGDTNSALILYRAGRISDAKRAEVAAALVALFQR